MYIYKTINLINNKIYIGKCSKKIEESKTYLGSGKLLHKAFKKYGIENFKKEILEECETLEELNLKEKYYIKIAKEEGNCYNIADGGDGGDIISTLSPEKRELHKKRSIEARQRGFQKYVKNNPEKIKSQAKFARSQVKNHGYGILFGKENGFFGKTHSKELKKSWVCVDRGRVGGKTYEEISGKEKAAKRKEKLSNSLKGKSLSEEHKESIRNKLKGTKISEQARKNREGFKWYVNKENVSIRMKDDDPRLETGEFKRGRKWK